VGRFELLFHRSAEGSEACFEARAAAWTVFSAIEVEESRSSTVAMKVDSFSRHPMFVMTLRRVRAVATVRPGGVLELSGETASATAFAVAELS
jgi:hypothetical protein